MELTVLGLLVLVLCADKNPLLIFRYQLEGVRRWWDDGTPPLFRISRNIFIPRGQEVDWRGGQCSQAVVDADVLVKAKTKVKMPC